MKGKRFGRRRLYPMPVEGIIDNPDFIAMPAAGRGILLSLLLHFWQVELRPLPIADHELRSIARAHAPTWRHWKPSVLKVFEAVKPQLVAYHKLRQVNGTSLSLAGQRSASQSKLRVIRQSATPSETIAGYAMGTIPKSDPRLPTKRKQQPESNRLTDRPKTT